MPAFILPLALTMLHDNGQEESNFSETVYLCKKKDKIFID